jgi:Tol biopolymer transport system component
MRREHSWWLVPACAAGFLVLAGLGVSPTSEEDPAVQLERAIQLETVDGDLQAAMAQYRQIVASNGNHRALAAKALLRLGGCYEKLGQKEAARVYRQLLDDYPDQAEEVAAARQRLATLPESTTETASPPRFRKLVVPSKPKFRSGGMLSPDGTRLAFLAEGAVWTVPVSGQVHPDFAGEPVRLTPDMRAWDNGNATLSWSADGKWISFHTQPKNSLYVVPAGGGEARLVLEHGGGGPGSLGSRAGLSPDGTSLAFAQYHEKEVSLFTVPVAGGNPKLLTVGPAIEPAFSPDGRYVAYVAREPGTPPGSERLVKILPAEGGTSIVVSRTTGEPVSPFWSPDGQSLAFVVWLSGGKKGTDRDELWIVSLTAERRPAAEPTRISLGEVTRASRQGKPVQKYTTLSGWSARDEIAVFTEVPFDQAIYTVSSSGGRATRVALEGREPRWSPDGKRVYFRGLKGIEHVPPGGGESLLVPIRSDDEVVVAYPMGSNDVSPDGTRIVFAGFSRKDQGGHIFTLPIEGGAPTPITNVERHEGVDSNPCWSPDGRWVAFTRGNEEGPSGWQVLHDILVMPSTGGAVRKISSDSDRVAYSELAWSPDGQSIAYFGKDRTIRLIPVEGGASRVLWRDESINPDSAYGNGLSWSPDGSELAYAVPPTGSAIKILPATGGEPRLVQTGFTGFLNQVAWSPDGRTFAFSGTTGGEEEIWLMSDFLPLVRKAR